MKTLNPAQTERLLRILRHPHFPTLEEMSIKMHDFAVRMGWTERPASNRGLVADDRIMRKSLAFINNAFVYHQTMDEEPIVDGQLLIPIIAQLLESAREPIHANEIHQDEQQLLNDLGIHCDGEWTSWTGNFVIWWIRHDGALPEWLPTQ